MRLNDLCVLCGLCGEIHSLNRERRNLTAETQKLEYQEEKKESILEFLLRREKGIFHYPLELTICFLSIALSIYHLFVAYAGSLEAHAFRSTHLAFVMILCFLLRPLGRKKWTDPRNAWFAVDLLCVLLTLAVQIYTLWDLEAFHLPPR